MHVILTDHEVISSTTGGTRGNVRLASRRLVEHKPLGRRATPGGRALLAEGRDATLGLTDIWDLACNFVPAVAADRRFSESGPGSWWPAHEIGHFLVATPGECCEPRFGVGIDMCVAEEEALYRYVIAKELAATSISQRLLRRSGYVTLADEEIEYTDEATLECSFERWCRRSVEKLLRANKVLRLPTTRRGLEALLARKAWDVAEHRS